MLDLFYVAFNDRTHTRDVGKFSPVRHHQKPLLHSKVRTDKAGQKPKMTKTGCGK